MDNSEEQKSYLYPRTRVTFLTDSGGRIGAIARTCKKLIRMRRIHDNSV